MGNGSDFRITNYRTQIQNIGNKKDQVIQLLRQEQNGLCAYCQRQLVNEKSGNVSIEHVIPNSLNIELSTSYHNLVLVCKYQKYPSTESNEGHCDTSKADYPITPFIFLNDCQVRLIDGIKIPHEYFKVVSKVGQYYIQPKHNPHDHDPKIAALGMQEQAFINLLYLNHPGLLTERTLALKSWQIGLSNKSITKSQVFNNIYNNNKTPFRQFLLIWLTP